MDIRQLEVFVKVFENLSFSKAAEQLGLSQPTVSAHVQHLEDFIGKKLFDRVGRRVVPTAEAKLLYRHAVEILRKREEAISELLSLDKTAVFKEVRIAASNIPGDYLLPHNLNRLRNIFSGAKVIVDILDSQKVLTVLLEKASIYDLGFVGTEVDDNRIESKKVLSDEIVLIAPPYFKKSEVFLNELSQLPLIMREPESGTRNAVERALKNSGLNPGRLNIVAFLGSNTAIKEAVKSGAGFGLVSKYSVRSELEYGLLKVVAVKGLKIERCFYAVRRRDITPSPAVKVIWESIEKLFKNGNCLNT